MGAMLKQKFDLIVENELTEDPDDSDSEITDSAGRKPGQGTQSEQEIWNDPEKRDQIQKPYQ